MSDKKRRHNNKHNKKVTHIARKDVKINTQWFEKYKECMESDREVWILNFNHAKPADLIAF